MDGKDDFQFGLIYNGWGEPDPGDFAAYVEDLGFDAVWVSEHIANYRPTLTVVPVLGAFAARTRRIAIGTAALLLPLRNPAIIAKELATVDIISRGRLVVGAGVGGENPAEFAACNIPVSERGSRTDEMLAILPRLWREPAVTFHGRHFHLDGVTLDPRAARPAGPPIYICGRKEAAFRRAARYGDGFMPYLYTPAQYATAMARIRALAADAGRDLASFVPAVHLFAFVADTQKEARRAVAAYLGESYQQDFSRLVEQFCVCGPPALFVERVREYIAAGARRFAFCVASAPQLVWQQQATVIAREIVPALRSRPLA